MDPTTPRVWLFASNSSTFDAEEEFRQADEIFWSETANAHVGLGDTVFLYGTRPVQALTHQCVVTGVGLPPDSAAGTEDAWVDEGALEQRQHRTWMVLRLVRTLDAGERLRLNLQALQNAGLKSAVQGRRRAPDGVLDLLRDVLVKTQTPFDADATVELYPSDDELVEAFATRIDHRDYAVSDLETYVPDRYTYQKTRGSAQRAFADRVKSNYGYTCAVTGISTPYFLVASHIVPWSEDPRIRLDPRNGLCLSTMVDRAFEDGYLRIDSKCRVHVNRERLAADPVLCEQLMAFDGLMLAAPAAEPPHPDFLQRRWDATV
ncbi:HNH endonuclease [Micrococcus terreus]|uniref:HNH endonuclease n=1 Tax=Micrococcus terreus TaxID=574650 RepID=UPI001C432B77|nr:HNH endonuclease signature motif containing protein [Micrococcus terreus]